MLLVGQGNPSTHLVLTRFALLLYTVCMCSDWTRMVDQVRLCDDYQTALNQCRVREYHFQTWTSLLGRGRGSCNYYRQFAWYMLCSKKHFFKKSTWTSTSVLKKYICVYVYVVLDTTQCVIVRGTGNGTSRPAPPAIQSSTTWNPTQPMSLECNPTLGMEMESGASQSFILWGVGNRKHILFLQYILGMAE